MSWRRCLSTWPSATVMRSETLRLVYLLPRTSNAHPSAWSYWDLRRRWDAGPKGIDGCCRCIGLRHAPGHIDLRQSPQPRDAGPANPAFPTRHAANCIGSYRSDYWPRSAKPTALTGATWIVEWPSCGSFRDASDPKSCEPGLSECAILANATQKPHSDKPTSPGLGIPSHVKAIHDRARLGV